MYKGQGMDMENIRQINGATKLCGVIGDPIGHTLSPLIHNTLAQAMQINLAYMPLHVYADELKEAIRGAHALGVQGMNVTVPHKQAVMPYLCGIDDAARAIGAVNTLVRMPDGYRGSNTDWLGLRSALKEEGISMKAADVLLLGAGGAARAAAYLCGYEGARSVTIINRTLPRAEELAGQMQALFVNTVYNVCETKEWTKLDGKGYICLQTTSVGMQPNDGVAVIEDPAFFQMLSAAVDIVYKPFVTKYMQLAKENGVQTCNGLMMLLYQAAAAFAMFTGEEPTSEAVAQAKKALLAQL